MKKTLKKELEEVVKEFDGVLADNISYLIQSREGYYIVYLDIENDLDWFLTDEGEKQLDQEKYSPFLTCIELEIPLCLTKILTRIEKKYNISLYRCAQANYKKFYIWSREFCNQADEEYIQTATCFVLYCCLVDKILDSERFPLNYKYMVYKDMDKFIEMSEAVTCDLEELYELRVKVQKFVRTKQKSDNTYALLQTKIDRAIKSEQFMAVHSVKDFDTKMEFEMVTDKSVEFVSAAFIIAAYDFAEKDVIIEASESRGWIFGYIDDICDYMSDMETGSLNSLLFICTDMQSDMSIEERMKMAAVNVDRAIEKLELNVKKLGKLVGKQLYWFILDELWDWMADVRRIMEG